MAKYINPSNIAWNKVNKVVTKTTNKVTKGVADFVVPKTPMDFAILPFARPIKSARLIAGITGKGAKAVTKTFRNMGNK